MFSFFVSCFVFGSINKLLLTLNCIISWTFQCTLKHVLHTWRMSKLRDKIFFKVIRNNGIWLLSLPKIYINNNVRRHMTLFSFFCFLNVSLFFFFASCNLKACSCSSFPFPSFPYYPPSLPWLLCVSLTFFFSWS